MPDVAALGDPQTGLLVGQTQTFPDGAYYDEYRIGGTSLVEPDLRGHDGAGRPGGRRAARLCQPAVLREPGAFYDVLSVKTAVARRNYNNSVDASAARPTSCGHSTTIPARRRSTRPGWDNVTGLGTPNGIFTSP